MADEISDLKKELIDVLDIAAMYNDKGYMWSGHSPERRAEIVAGYQVSMLSLMGQIGADALAPELAQAIVSGAAAWDDLGYFSRLVRRS
ncbi:hypothetical protein [Pseudoduganella sp. R-34]|uniref:hypothetical protein n=1 Tax=unclassified Pseudoduganella TaxID=2637179 RepID=UPI003CE801E8